MHLVLVLIMLATGCGSESRQTELDEILIGTWYLSEEQSEVWHFSSNRILTLWPDVGGGYTTPYEVHSNGGIWMVQDRIYAFWVVDYDEDRLSIVYDENASITGTLIRRGQ
jgi:hypothetical protein